MADGYTIHVSSNLINQLAGEEKNIKKKTKKPKPKVPKEPRQPDSKVTKAPSTQKSSPGGGWPHQPPIFLPVTPQPPPVAIAELEAIRAILQESERVLEKLDRQEADKIQEVNQRAKELHDKEFQLPYQKPVPCTAEREACLHCYREHTKDPLKCAQVVKNFADCTRQARRLFSATVSE